MSDSLGNMYLEGTLTATVNALYTSLAFSKHEVHLILPTS